jgi:hypothetical protein
MTVIIVVKRKYPPVVEEQLAEQLLYWESVEASNDLGIELLLLLLSVVLVLVLVLFGGPGSSVGIATDYRLDGPGQKTKSRWGEIFCTRPDRPWGPPNLVYNGCRVFPGGKAAGAWF